MEKIMVFRRTEAEDTTDVITEVEEVLLHPEVESEHHQQQQQQRGRLFRSRPRRSRSSNHAGEDQFLESSSSTTKQEDKKMKDVVLANLLRIRLRGLPSSKNPHSVIPYGETDCILCMEALEINDIVIKLPCGHIYHNDCCCVWLCRSTSCPTCRFRITPESITKDEIQLSASAVSVLPKNFDLIMKRATRNSGVSAAPDTAVREEVALDTTTNDHQEHHQKQPRRESTDSITSTLSGTSVCSDDWSVDDLALLLADLE
jgi:hypothetical protein